MRVGDETRLGSERQNQQLLHEAEQNIVICRWRTGLRQIIDLRDTNNTPCFDITEFYDCCIINCTLVPRAYDPSGLWLGSRALAGPDFLSMRRVFVSHCQPIRFAGFDGKSVNHGLPVLDQTRALDPNHRPEGS